MTDLYERFLSDIRANPALSARLSLLGYDISRLEELDMDELQAALQAAQRLNGDYEDDD